MTTNSEIAQIRKEIAKGRERLRKASILSKGIAERQKLRKQLSEMQNPTSNRIKRGFKILARKAGRGLKRQATLIRERQIKQAKTIKKGRKKQSSIFSNVFAPLEI